MVCMGEEDQDKLKPWPAGCPNRRPLEEEQRGASHEQYHWHLLSRSKGRFLKPARLCDKAEVSDEKCFSLNLRSLWTRVWCIPEFGAENESVIFCNVLLLSAVWRVRGRFQNLRQTPVCTKLRFKRFPRIRCKKHANKFSIKNSGPPRPPIKILYVRPLSDILNGKISKEAPNTKNLPGWGGVVAKFFRFMPFFRPWLKEGEASANGGLVRSSTGKTFPEGL